MNVLVACEESQAVTIEFRKLGVNAFSCDIQECSGGSPEWHIQDDVLKVLNNKWDLVIAFPPCTHLAVSGAAWFDIKKKDGRQKEGIDFFLLFTKIDGKFAIENPVGIMSNIYRKPDQVIHPWQFGHMEQKSTCLWLNKLNLLKPTDIVYTEMKKLDRKIRERIHWVGSRKDRSKIRSKTFQGIAHAMANQWSKELGKKYYLFDNY